MIKLLLTDLDGCLTDGGYYVSSSPNSPIFKKINTRDFHGMSLLYRDFNIKSTIVTRSGSGSEIIKGKNFVSIINKCMDKKKAIDDAYVKPKIHSWEEIAFIGDDENDLELLKSVGLAACPADAEDIVKDAVLSRLDGFVLSRKGGDACVREFINLIILLQKGIGK